MMLFADSQIVNGSNKFKYISVGFNSDINPQRHQPPVAVDTNSFHMKIQVIKQNKYKTLFLLKYWDIFMVIHVINPRQITARSIQLQLCGDSSGWQNQDPCTLKQYHFTT